MHSKQNRLQIHNTIPPLRFGAVEPLNNIELSNFKHDQDPSTYRGLGARSDVKEGQRIAQVFLARSLAQNSPIDKTLLNKAVSRVVGLKALSKGYIT